MKNYYKYIYISLIYFIACNPFSKNDVVDHESILKAINEIYEGRVESNAIFLIIPNAGCPGCISSSEEFMISNSGLYNNKIKFILTNFKSLNTTLRS